MLLAVCARARFCLCMLVRASACAFCSVFGFSSMELRHLMIACVQLSPWFRLGLVPTYYILWSLLFFSARQAALNNTYTATIPYRLLAQTRTIVPVCDGRKHIARGQDRKENRKIGETGRRQTDPKTKRHGVQALGRHTHTHIYTVQFAQSHLPYPSALKLVRLKCAS